VMSVAGELRSPVFLGNPKSRAYENHGCGPLHHPYMWSKRTFSGVFPWIYRHSEIENIGLCKSPLIVRYHLEASIN